MWKRVKYFFENWNDSCMSVFDRMTQLGISLKQRGKLFYKKCYSTALQGNLRMTRDQFWPLLILCWKSAKNFPSRKLEYLSPQSCYTASQGGKWKIFAKCIFVLWVDAIFVWFLQHCQAYISIYRVNLSKRGGKDGVFRGISEGEAQGKFWGAALPARGKPRPSDYFTQIYILFPTLFFKVLRSAGE